MKHKRSMFISFLLGGLFFGALNVGASNGIETIKASLNRNIKFLLNEKIWTPKDQIGNALVPISYNDSTYIPLRAVGEALGAEIDWDGKTSTVIINESGYDTSKPTTDSVAIGAVVDSSLSGRTEDDAIPIGQSATFSSLYDVGGASYSGKYTVSVSKVRSITESQLSKLGFRMPAQEGLGYKLVTVKVVMKDGKFTSDSDDPMFKLNTVDVATHLKPEIWGSKAYLGDSALWGIDEAFSGSLKSAIEKATNSKTLKVGEISSYSVEGEILIPVVKDKLSFIVFKTGDIHNSDESLIYFKLFK